MRVLFTSTPGAGHVHPMVPMALALREAGHDVVWATAPDGIARLEPLGLACRSAGLDGATRFARQFERDPGILELPMRERRPRLAPMFSAVAAPVMLEDLRPLVAELRPDLLVHEPLELAAPIVAAAFELPHAGIGFGGLFADWVFEILVEDLHELWSSSGLGLAPFAGGIYEHLYLHPAPPSFAPVPPDRNILPVRPLNFDGADGAPAPPWIADFGRERPGVYVTFGTEFAGAAPFRTVIDGLAPLDVDVVVTAGHAVDPAGIGTPPANVRVERYVPQRFVLERTSLLVSHAGSGATLGAAARGIPHLALPLGADQFDNALLLAAAGAGGFLDAEELTPEAVRAEADRLLTEPAFATAAGRLAAEIAAMPEPRERVADLEALAD